MYGFGSAVLGIALWSVTNMVFHDEFDQHVADKQCERATDRWITKANALDRRKNDQNLIQAEREARETKEQQCGKKG